MFFAGLGATGVQNFSDDKIWKYPKSTKHQFWIKFWTKTIFGVKISSFGELNHVKTLKFRAPKAKPHQIFGPKT